MEKDYTLTVRLRPPLHDNLTRYSKRTGLTLAGAVRCWVMGLDGEGTPEEMASLDALIERLQRKREHRRAALLRTPTAAAAAAETEEGRNEP